MRYNQEAGGALGYQGASTQPGSACPQTSKSAGRYFLFCTKDLFLMLAHLLSSRTLANNKRSRQNK